MDYSKFKLVSANSNALSAKFEINKTYVNNSILLAKLGSFEKF